MHPFTQQCGHYLISNDTTLCGSQPYKAVGKQIAKQKKQPNHVALLVGQSHLFSYLAGLPDLIIVCDIDQGLLDYLTQVRKLLLMFGNMPEYRLFQMKPTLIQTLIKYQVNLTGKPEESISKALRNDIGDMGSAHFLYNQENLTRCIQALKRKTIMFKSVDLFCGKSVGQFKAWLFKQGYKVSVLNLTNVADYDYHDKLSVNLSNLPLAPESILVTTSIYPPNLSIVSHWKALLKRLKKIAHSRKTKAC